MDKAWKGNNLMKDWIVPLVAFEENLARGERPSWQGLSNGTMRTYLFRPGAWNPQALKSLVEAIHSQDEIYIVLRGNCAFSKMGDVRDVKTGDVIFVEAGAEHGFESYSDDFAAWVIFWGPSGGEEGLA